MFVQVAVAVVEPRGQYDTFFICPDGATCMAGTVFCEAFLAVYLRVKRFSLSGAFAAQVMVPLP